VTEPVAPRELRTVRALAVVVLGGVVLRLLVSLVAGFVEWHERPSDFLSTGRVRAFDVLTTFGSAGDAAGVALALVAAGLLWWLCRLGDPGPHWMWTAALCVFVVTGVFAVMDCVGIGLVFSVEPEHQVSRLIGSGGAELAVAVIAAGGVVAMRQLGTLSDELLLDTGDGSDALVFAVDRSNGDVRAFFSIGEAARRTHVYLVEDDEFVFYTDEGVVLDATVEHGRVLLRPTEASRQAELLGRLKAFVNRRGIAIDAQDADDPTSYVVPISDWQWLQNWPPWMRGLGRLFRPRLNG